MVSQQSHAATSVPARGKSLITRWLGDVSTGQTEYFWAVCFSSRGEEKKKPNYVLLVRPWRSFTPQSEGRDESGKAERRSQDGGRWRWEMGEVTDRGRGGEENGIRESREEMKRKSRQRPDTGGYITYGPCVINETLMKYSSVTQFALLLSPLIHLFFLSSPWSLCHFQSISRLGRTSGIRQHISNLLISPSTCVITRPWTLVNLLFYNKAGRKHLLSSDWRVNSELTSSDVTLPFQLLGSAHFWAPLRPHRVKVTNQWLCFLNRLSA